MPVSAQDASRYSILAGHQLPPVIVSGVESKSLLNLLAEGARVAAL
ncbi:MAG: hypothetical protein ABSB01_24975 [Streptosporangiaceae bacterium]|jgi:hypothetical protein